MLVEVPMPKMGESIMEGTIIKWYKEAGDFVKKDETLFEISTDKVDTEVPSLAEGIVSKIFVKVNETVGVGTVVALIETETGSKAEHDIKPEKKVDAPKPVKVAEETRGEVVDVIMPKMGESIMEGTVIRWYKKVGEEVKKEEPLFEISTDKVDTEVPSPVDGKILSILVKEQETVSIGTVVCKIGSGEVISMEEEKTEPISMHDQIAHNAEMPMIETEIKDETKTDVNNTLSSKFFSPLVINIANAEKISLSELEAIEGTGIGGRITKKDVLKYIEVRKGSGVKETYMGIPVVKSLSDVKEESRTEEKYYQPPTQSKIEVVQTGRVERIPMDNIRTKIMNHMIYSRDTSVHVTGVVEVDMTRVANYMKKKKEAFLKNEGIKLTYTTFIALATVKALKEFPLVNASIDGSTILVKKNINLGIAVAVEPNGLIVPNIKNAEEKNLIGIAKSINDLADRARTKKLVPDDISGGTFTITNYGVFGSLFGTPIINQPEVAILGAGAVVKRPVVVEVDGMDTIAIKPMMYLSLSHDHRLVDGMLGGRFLNEIRKNLEGFEM